MSTENFKKWFGDSKVVDNAGNPLVVYHGTPNGLFDEFDTTPAFFASSEEAAKGYAEGRYSRDSSDANAPVVLAVYLNLKNPKVYTASQLAEILPADEGDIEWSDFDNLAYELEAQGFDGVIITGAHDYMGGTGDEVRRGVYDQYVAFDARQIKSANGNTGQFNPYSASLTDHPRQEEEIPAARERMAA